MGNYLRDFMNVNVIFLPNENQTGLTTEAYNTVEPPRADRH